MHTRQAGVAHVNIFFFLILLVLFLGSLGFAWVTLNDKNTADEENATLRGKNQRLEKRETLWLHYKEDLADVIKIPGTYEGRPELLDGYKGETIQACINPTALRQKLGAFCDAVEVTRMNSLDGVLGEVKAKFDSKNQAVAAAETARDRVANEKGQVDTQFASATRTHRDEQTTLTANLTQAQTDFGAEKARLENLIEATRQNLNDKTDELAQAREEWSTEKRGLQQEIAQLRGHNSALAQKMAMHNAPNQPDGKVIASVANVDHAWIGVGAKDLLRTGTVFRIKNANSDGVKAYGTVTKVEQARAEIKLTGVVDPIGDQVRPGDLIFNDLYSPNVRRNIYLMGRFSYPYNKPELTALLERLGNNVAPAMVPGVGLVILGDSIINEEGDGFTSVEDTDEYKKALFWGVEFAPLHKIRDLIKL